MPRAFDHEERRLVKEDLLKAGDELFGRHGFSRTAVTDITDAAGVAKGTFYNFWPSKEEFFFACLERAELRFQSDVVAPALDSADSPADALGRILRESFGALEDDPIISRALDADLMNRLTRRLSPETLERHRRTDQGEFAEIMASWEQADFDPGIPPEVFDGIFKGLMMMHLHRDIIGEDLYPRVIEGLSRIVSAGTAALAERQRTVRKEDAS